jgi:hypothetical protein
MSAPTHPPEPASRLRSFFQEWALPIAELTIRIAAIILSAYLLLEIPLPLEGTSLTLEQALIILVSVALIGITLLETLFYDRFRP